MGFHTPSKALAMGLGERDQSADSLISIDTEVKGFIVVLMSFPHPSILQSVTCPKGLSWILLMLFFFFFFFLSYRQTEVTDCYILHCLGSSNKLFTSQQLDV